VTASLGGALGPSAAVALLGGVSPGFAGIAIPAFAAGGLVNRPTLAMVGESGPEAVIPLQGGKIPTRMESGRPIQVVMNIQTPDIGSFRASQGQLSGQLALALQRAQKRSI